MVMLATRTRLLSGCALGLGLAIAAAQPARAASGCVPGAPTTVPLPAFAADCTSVNGNGHVEASWGSGAPGFVYNFGSLVVGYFDTDEHLATGYIESTLAGQDVLRITSIDAVTYTGTASTLVGQATATNATILSITAPGVTLFSGNLTALGAGSTALSVTANGGAGSGGIDATIDGDIFSAGAGINLNSTNALATGDIELTSTAGNTITSTGGDAVNIDSQGSGKITVDVAGPVSATRTSFTDGFGIKIRNAAAGGDISLTTGEVTSDNLVIDVLSTSSTADITIVSNGALTGIGTGGAIAADIFNTSSTGDINVTTNGAVTGSYGVIASTNGAGSVSVTAVGPIAASGGAGIGVGSSGGDINITAGTVSGGNAGISAGQFDATGTGNVSVTTTGAVSGNIGIIAGNSGTGEITASIGGDVTSSVGSAVQLTANGAITYSGSGMLTTTGANAIGLDVNGGIGAIDVTVAGADTTGTGVDISSTGAAAVSFTNLGLITSDGLVGVKIGDPFSTPATVTADCGDITVNADGAAAFIAFAAGELNVTCGTITANGDSSDGIVVRSNNGPLTVTGTTTNMNGVNSTGIDAFTQGGALVVNTGDITAEDAGSIGVLAGSLFGGAVTVNVTGDVSSGGSGVTANTTGPVTLNVLAGNTLSGGTFGTVLGSQTSVIANIDGTIESDSGSAIVANPFGNTAPVTVNIGTTGIVNGFVTLGTANDDVNNGGNFNASGTSDFGTGTDSFDNLDGGTLNLTSDVTFTNLETFTQDGLIDLGTFTLTGPAIAFVNAGTIDTDGNAGLAGFTAFTNLADVDLGPGIFTAPDGPFTNSGTIFADEGASTITGQTSFANSGTIDLQDGATGDVLTIDSDFAGSGDSALLLDASSTVGDRLVIAGAASGTTEITVNLLGDIFINTDGILLVDADSSSANAFVLGNALDTALIDVDLVQEGGDFLLVSTPNIAAIEPVVVGELAQNLWYQSADIYSNYAALRRTDLGVNRTSGLGVWGQVYWGRDKTDGQDLTVFDTDFSFGRVETERLGAQFGVDYLIGTNVAIGMTGGYEHAEADIRHSASDFEGDGYNIGAYAMFGGGSGLYADLLVKYDSADLEFNNVLFDAVVGDPDIKSFGVQGEAGYRFMSGSVSFDLGAGLAHVSSKVDDFAVGTIAFDFDSVKSTRGHIGARAGFGTGTFAPFIEAKLFHEFSNDRDLELVSGTAVDVIEGEGRGTWGRIEAGIGANNGSGPIFAAWGDFGDVKGFGVKAGWRFGGDVVVAPPPPPPPAPPPPPPATQPCPDGSVILATDSCPLPPPPPPPPPPAPERG